MSLGYQILTKIKEVKLHFQVALEMYGAAAELNFPHGPPAGAVAAATAGTLEPDNSLDEAGAAKRAKYRGVIYHKQNGKWEARAYAPGRKQVWPCFSSLSPAFSPALQRFWHCLTGFRSEDIGSALEEERKEGFLHWEFGGN